MKPWFKTLLLCLSLAAGAVVVDRLLPSTVNSVNDLHLVWLLEGRSFFNDNGHGFMELNPELIRLGNTPERFSRTKAPGTFRIFCVGGSTTRGWPFHERLSYPRVLSLILRDALGSRSIEVINAGLLASDSWSDRRLVEELSAFEPDLFLIYEGRNDAWNLPLHVGWRSAILSAHTWLLRHVRFYGLLRRLAGGSEQRMNQAHTVRNWAEGSREKAQADHKQLFQRNLRSLAKSASARTLFLTQVVSPEEEQRYPIIVEINNWMREWAETEKVEIIDIDAEFRKRWDRSPEYIIPHPATHPDMAGYELMARAVAQGLTSRGLPAPANQWHWNKVRADSEYRHLLEANDHAYLSDVYQRVARVFADTGSPEIARYYRDKSLETSSAVRR
jgi:lysophospholipase L1-like esterase